MPRFFFNVIDGAPVRDTVGVDLNDIREAHMMAVRFSSELLRDHPDALWTDREWRVEVTDRAGTIFFAIQISAIEAPENRDKNQRQNGLAPPADRTETG